MTRPGRLKEIDPVEVIGFGFNLIFTPADTEVTVPPVTEFKSEFKVTTRKPPPMLTGNLEVKGIGVEANESWLIFNEFAGSDPGIN
jgi:hypothetical protein